jgi:ankyrin repeat protein
MDTSEILFFVTQGHALWFFVHREMSKIQVRLLVERGASLDIQDTVYHGTPLGWALYAGQTEIEKYLRAQAGSTD